MAFPISLAILNLLGGAGQGYNQGTQKGREGELALVDRLIGQKATREAQAYGTSERVASQGYQSGERKATQEFQTGERVGSQGFQTGERVAGQGFQTSERKGSQTFQSGESALNRTLQGNIAGLESRTAIRAAQIHEGLDTSDPLSLAKTMGAKAYMEALSNPLSLQRGETPELKALQTYNLFKQMGAEQGLFAPETQTIGGEPYEATSYNRGIGPNKVPPNPYSGILDIIGGTIPKSPYGISPFLLDLISQRSKVDYIRTEP